MAPRYRNLLDYLRKTGERQEDLAKRVGLHQSTISIIANRGTTKLKTAKRLVRACPGVPLESFGGE